MELHPPAALVAELADRYRIERLLGRGGMGAVYLAQDVRHKREVALKLVSAEAASAGMCERFRHEIDAVAHLNHPHVVPLFDSGVTTGRPWFVMPYVRGGSLRGRLEREPRLPLEEALRLTHEIASGLGHAHRAGIIHLDVKPENVLLADGLALVSDFGLARTRDRAGAGAPPGTAPPPSEGGLLGTPIYMAPELVLGLEVDARADLYALACMLYEMLAGRPPFVAETRPELLRMHVAAEPAPLDTLRPDVPAGLAVVIARGLAKSPAGRDATAAQFAEALAQGARAGDAWNAARPESRPSSTPHNLPRTRTRFIGRSQELADCREHLERARLLTITGIGGCGKTRLALRVAEASLEAFPGGVGFADLAPVQDAERVALVAAAALSVAATPGVPVTDSLAAALADRRALLVLDNCEHVLGAAGALATAILAASPGSRVLCTSREGLGVPDEHVVALRSLSLPAAEGLLPAIDSDAVRLFQDRARAVEPEFAVTDENAPVVVEICRRLDGIPLAIELAAARVLVLSLAEIRARLDDRFRLLTGGPRAALPRHQTLAAAIGWSYDLLEPGEQVVFRRLSVFAGGCTLAAAAQVTGEDGDEFDVLDRLARLAEKSLLDVVRATDGATRYHVLETVRQFAHGKLESEADGSRTRDRHLAHYLALAEEADAHVRGPEAGRWLARLELERENLLAAHAWCDVATDGGPTGLRLQAALTSYWRSRNLPELGLRLAEEALARPGAAPRTAPRARLLARASLLAMSLGTYARAFALASESVDIARERADAGLSAMALLHLGAVAGAMRDDETALRCTLEGIQFAEQSGERMLLSAMLNNLGELHRIRGELDAAEDAYERALASCREVGRVEGVATNLANQCYILIPRGRLDEARARLREALQLCREHGLDHRALATFDLVMALAMASGEAGFAAELWGAMEQSRSPLRTRREPWDEAFVQEWRERARAALGANAFAEAEAWGREQSREGTLEAALAWLEPSGAA